MILLYLKTPVNMYLFWKVGTQREDSKITFKKKHLKYAFSFVSGAFSKRDAAKKIIFV